jgi:hypothetical protein
MLDTSKCPIVDAHCHPFLPEKESKPFEAYLTLSDISQRKEDLESTMIYRQTIRELARVLRVDRERAVEERQKRIKENASDYVQMLFDDAGIEALLVDSGYPFKEYVGYEIDLGDFSEMVGREVHEIFRIEAAVYGLLKGQLPFDEAVEDLRTRIGESVKGGVISLKSIIAYRTGLAVRTWEEPFVRRSWDEMTRLVRGGRNPGDVLSERNDRNKAVYDNFLMVGIEEAVRLGVPIQIHTGMGDSPSMDLRLSNPALLYDLLQTPKARGAQLVLTHGGYPYIEEAGFLVNAYPNVHLDLSQTIPFVSVGLQQRLLNVLETAPTTKIMYGSDGFNIPEINWIAAIQTRKALKSALEELVKKGELEEDDALGIAEAFLSENARRLYRI